MTILHGDCREQLAALSDCSVDAIVTDPPYGLEFMGKEWDTFRTGRSVKYASGGDLNVEGMRKRSGKGGAGPSYVKRPAKRCGNCGKQAWSGSPCECETPRWIVDNSPLHAFQAWCETWARECLRVLKPGGHILAFGGTRTYHRMTVAIEDAGFEIRDSIHWLYGSGFPKSLDVSKAIDKVAGHWRGKAGSVIGQSHSMENPHYERTEKGDPITPAAAAAGWGTALKPAHEPIVLARKPLAGTVAANVMEYGTGALNIDACRVAGALDGDPHRFAKTDGGSFVEFSTAPVVRADGRWPANIILTHAPDCADNCAPDCPITILDTQSGERPGGSFPTQRGAGVATGFGPGKPTEGGRRDMGDIGGASRYFATTTWDPELDVPFLYVAKPSRAERNAGLDANFHPTVKPVALMRHLIRLITPPGGIVLDPFLGSGTTAVAAVLEGFEWIGCELTDDYVPIIEARVAHAQTIPIQQDLFA